MYLLVHLSVRDRKDLSGVEAYARAFPMCRAHSPYAYPHARTPVSTPRVPRPFGKCLSPLRARNGYMHIPMRARSYLCAMRDAIDTSWLPLARAGALAREEEADGARGDAGRREDLAAVAEEARGGAVLRWLTRVTSRGTIAICLFVCLCVGWGGGGAL